VTNATVVPSGSLGFLTLWADGIAQPLVSTLNAQDGSVTSNMAIVSTTNGSFDAFASSDTQLNLDVSDYFASPPGPAVVLVGDSVMTAWLTPTVLAAHPNWTAQTSPAGTQETTAQIAARFPAAIALHPQIIVIEAGTWSMAPADQPSWMCNYGGTLDNSGLDNPCDDIGTMVSEAEQAGAYVIVCTIPPWDVGPLATQIDATSAEPYTRRYNVGSFNFALPGLNGQHSVVPADFADLYGLLNDTSGDTNPWWMFVSEDDVDYFYDPAYTTDGVYPDPAAQTQIVSLIQAQITASKIQPQLRR
jgi:hypothetical protein